MCLKRIFVCVLLAIAVLAVYWQVHTFDFVSLDDHMYVRDNPVVQNGLNLDTVHWAFSEVYASNWHPLTWISHMADVDFFGMNPGRHHLTSVVLHLLNGILLFLVLERMTGAMWKSAMVAALFALHPVHVESVAWISERKDVLSTLFWLLTMAAYLWYVKRPKVGRYGAVAVMLGLGLMAKPMLVTLPFALLLLDFWPLDRVERTIRGYPRLSALLNLCMEKLPLLAIAVAAGGMTFYAQSAGGAVNPLDRLAVSSRIINAITAYVLYLYKTLWPLDLAAFYPYPERFNLVLTGACLVLLSAITLFVLVWSRKLPYLVTGWFWYLGTLVPVIGFVQVGSQSMADRYTYIPLIGIFIIAVWGGAELAERVWSDARVPATISIVLLALLSWLAWAQAGTWRDSETLFSHALKVTSDNYLAHNSLGAALFEKGDTDQAMLHYRESLRIKPCNVNAHCNLGIALAKKRGYEEALEEYRECLRIRPGHPEALYNMALLMSDLGKTDEAIRNYQAILENNPYHEKARNNLGYLFAGKGMHDEARDQYLKVLDINPGNVRTRINLADSLSALGAYDEAVHQVGLALQVQPGNPALHVKLGEIYMRKGDAVDAERSYKSALDLSRDFPPALHGLAVLLVGQQRYGEAVALLREMGKARPDDPEVDYNIACIHSRQNNIEAAAESLRAAMKKGFHDRQLMENDRDLENFRKSGLYPELLKTMK